MNSQERLDADMRATEAQIDAMMQAARALIGIAAQSVAEVEDQVTLPQLRVLVLVESRGTLNLNRLAEAMGIHPSNATRACDRLVAIGLLQRRESATDRRNLVLELTDRGKDLVDSVIAHRRVVIADVLSRVPERRRRGLATAMTAFADGAGEAFADNAWKLGWPS
ncbi:MarR family winged helix-turn-helix transcriptional regulator [Antrihabitans cavernicola]|uniref:MarR family transcriptional regulator n=1 Tax=Antrihabitans cavernicola TaxID=2495913 RepID=A0A5A7S0P7_9NOCA|nr:MarR family transcriptional regulator [Spelaeibacter cavernicola]KAA0016349.1 MarR family transcriptional regulator [Spelaeibacter cavernicola]